MLLHIWVPIESFISPEWVSATFEISICSIVIIGYGIVGWDIWKRHNIIVFITVGIVLIVIFGNLVGILLILVGIVILFGLD